MEGLIKLATYLVFNSINDFTSVSLKTHSIAHLLFVKHAHRELGKGPAWEAEHAGLRLVAWLVHAPLMLGGQDKQLKSRLLAAIARRLDGARAPAAFLSGGVDSALLCALARHGGHAIEAWSVGFDDATLDESATAARIAAHLGLRHHVLRPDLDALEAFIGSLETSKSLQVSGITTSLSSEAELKAALREKSIAATRAKAEEMAKAFGVRLAGVYSVSDVAPQFSYGIQPGTWSGGYQWSRESGTLDAITVTGSRIDRTVSLRTGYVTFSDKIYAVFLIAD